jgi:hypothetical protein
MATPINGNTFSGDDVLRQIHDLHQRYAAEDAQTGKEQRTAAIAESSGTVGITDQKDRPGTRESQAADATLFSEETEELKGTGETEGSGSTVQLLQKELNNFVSTGGDNRQKDRSHGIEALLGEVNSYLESGGPQDRRRRESQAPEGKPGQGAQNGGPANDMELDRAIKEDPMKVLQMKNEDESLKAGQQEPAQDGKEKPVAEETGKDSLEKMNAKINFNNEVSDGDLVSAGQKFAKFDLEVNGDKKESFLKGLAGEVEAKVGKPVVVENDGIVKATTPMKINFGDVAGKTMSGRGDDMETISATHLDGAKPFEAFMNGQKQDEFGKAKEYLEKNPDAPDAGWVRSRLSQMEEQKDVSNSESLSTKSKKETFSSRLLDDYRSLNRGGQ